MTTKAQEEEANARVMVGITQATACVEVALEVKRKTEAHIKCEETGALDGLD